MTIIFYDNTGYIYLQTTNIDRVPQGGINYLEVEIENDKYVEKIDVTVTPNIPVYKDIPPSETEILKQKVAEQEAALIELAALVGGAE